MHGAEADDITTCSIWPCSQILFQSSLASVNQLAGMLWALDLEVRASTIVKGSLYNACNLILRKSGQALINME